MTQKPVRLIPHRLYLHSAYHPICFADVDPQIILIEICNWICSRSEFARTHAQGTPGLRTNIYRATQTKSLTECLSLFPLHIGCQPKDAFCETKTLQACSQSLIVCMRCINIKRVIILLIKNDNVAMHFAECWIIIPYD